MRFIKHDSGVQLSVGAEMETYSDLQVTITMKVASLGEEPSKKQCEYQYATLGKVRQKSLDFLQLLSNIQQVLFKQCVMAPLIKSYQSYSYIVLHSGTTQLIISKGHHTSHTSHCHGNPAISDNI